MFLDQLSLFTLDCCQNVHESSGVESISTSDKAPDVRPEVGDSGSCCETKGHLWVAVLVPGGHMSGNPTNLDLSAPTKNAGLIMAGHVNTTIVASPTIVVGY